MRNIVCLSVFLVQVLTACSNEGEKKGGSINPKVVLDQLTSAALVTEVTLSVTLDIEDKFSEILQHDQRIVIPEPVSSNKAPEISSSEDMADFELVGVMERDWCAIEIDKGTYQVSGKIDGNPNVLLIKGLPAVA